MSSEEFMEVLRCFLTLWDVLRHFEVLSMYFELFCRVSEASEAFYDVLV